MFLDCQLCGDEFYINYPKEGIPSLIVDGDIVTVCTTCFEEG